MSEFKRVWNLSIESHCYYLTVTGVSDSSVVDKVITTIAGMGLLAITQ